MSTQPSSGSASRHEVLAVPPGPAVLIVAHPGHELRLHGWLEAVRPTVMVLTDGSGGTGRPRIESTTALLERAGAARGSIYGRLTDAAVYEALLGGNVGIFTAMVEEIAVMLVRDGVTCVVADAAEGYNPTHDICRLVTDAAVRIVRATHQTPIANFGFPLVGRPDSGSADGGLHLCFELDDAALDRKLLAAHAYVELADEVAAAILAWGSAVFRREYLFEADAAARPGPADGQLFYEKHGEARVASGAYRQVIRYEQHVRPLADALGQFMGLAFDSLPG